MHRNIKIEHVPNVSSTDSSREAEQDWGIVFVPFQYFQQMSLVVLDESLGYLFIPKSEYKTWIGTANYMNVFLDADILYNLLSLSLIHKEQHCKEHQLVN